MQPSAFARRAPHDAEMGLAMGLVQWDAVGVQRPFRLHAAAETVALLAGTQSTISCQNSRKQPMAMRRVSLGSIPPVKA